MDFKTIKFGKADAHSEGESSPELLKEGFLNISSVADVAINSEIFLFLGYKGSGKSSLSEHLWLKAEEDIVVDQQPLKDFPFKEFDKIPVADDRLIRYKKLWDWLLYVKVFEDLYNDSSSAIKSTENVKKVITVLTQLGIIPVMNISSLVKKDVTDSIKISHKLLELSRTVNKETIGVNLELLTNYLKQLLSAFKESKRHIMIIDDLDDILSPKGIQLSVISALISEVKELNRFFRLNYIPFKILVLCRSDMFDRLPDPNKNKIKQDNSFTFTWYREGINRPGDSELIKLINIRAKLVYPDLEDVIQSFFPTTFQGRPIHTALLDFTRHTPRDFIQLMNHIQKQCSENTEKVSNVAIENGVKDYSSEYFQLEIDDEMSGYLTGSAREGVFNALSSLHKRDFAYNEFIEACQYRPNLKNYDIDEILRILYDCSAIGHIYSYDGGVTNRITFKYRNRSSAFNPNDRIMLHKGLWKALNVNY